MGKASLWESLGTQATYESAGRWSVPTKINGARFHKLIAVSKTPSILDFLRQNALLDGDIDAAVDARLADPSIRSYVLQSLYRVDFDEIAASARRAASTSSKEKDGDDRQALMCALLMHRPQILRPDEMAASAAVGPEEAEVKDLYEMGEIPPLGHVPAKMYAWAIRRERHGPPEQSYQLEVLPVWEIGDDEVLVYVMAAGVNYNGVWAGLGEPISPFDVHKGEYHIAGSDASGIVWKVGSKVKRWKVGDEVIVHCNRDDGDDEECNGGDPMFSPSQRIWGYETGDGSFAQFCRVQSRQLMVRPKHLTWEEAACYTLTLATAYRMLFGHAPHTVKPGQNVLIWGASGGLGVFGVQLCAASGANAIAVISDESKRDYVMSLGAKGVINRTDFDCWGQLPKVNSPEFHAWTKEARKFGKAIWEITGKQDVDIVFEHPGEATFPVSALVVKRGGMVVFCAGTTGFNITFDARYVWMRQKRIQGSHFAHLKQASSANQFVLDRRIDPCMSEVFPWDKIPQAHTKMWKNQHPPGNMACLVNAPRAGLRTVEDVIEAGPLKR